MIKFVDNNIEWNPNIKSMFKKLFKAPETQKYIKEQDFTALFDKATTIIDLGEGRLISTVAEVFIKSGIDIMADLNTIPLYFLTESNLQSIDIEPNIEIIKAAAFADCSDLKEVNIQGNNLSIIEKYAFSNCNKLKKINFPRSLIAIDMYAFEYCTSLKEITYAGTIEELKQIKHFQKMRSIAHVDSSSIFENNIVFHCIDGDVKYSSGIERWKKL